MAGSLDRYPDEFSGGQRQRLGITRALMTEPVLLAADEPIFAFDVSVQDQVVQWLLKIRARIKLAMLFITRDLRIAGQICDRVGVLQNGVLVEEGTAESVLEKPRHP